MGMSDVIGPRAIGASMPGQAPAQEGSELKDLADDEVDRILTEQYERGMKILTENRDVLDEIAKILIEKEKISGVELLKIIQGKNPSLVKDGAMDKVIEAANPKDKVESYAFMFSNATSEVQKNIDENPVMVFSKSYCPHCNKAKSILNDWNIDYKAIELDNPEGEELFEALKQLSGQRTVPNIYVKGK